MTKNFLVLNISRKGLHRNLIVQGHIIKDVQNAIFAFGTSRFLNMTAATMLSTTNGSPIAKYTVGTQLNGCLKFFFFLSIVIAKLLNESLCRRKSACDSKSTQNLLHHLIIYKRNDVRNEGKPCNPWCPKVAGLSCSKRAQNLIGIGK